MDNIKFELNELESKRAREFAKRHENCHEDSAGLKLRLIIVPTRLGDIIDMNCMGCGSQESITDMKKF